MIDFIATSGIDVIEKQTPGLRYAPITHELIIDDNSLQISSLELYDIRGRKIITFALHGEHRIKLDESIPNGLFIMVMNKMDGRVISEKISIQR